MMVDFLRRELEPEPFFLSSLSLSLSSSSLMADSWRDESFEARSEEKVGSMARLSREDEEPQ